MENNWRMLFAAATLLGVTLLTASLHEFKFKPPVPIAWKSVTPIQFSFAQIIAQVNEIPAWKHILFWAASLLIIGLVSSLLSAEMRKRLLRLLIRFASFVFIFLFIIRRNPDLLPLLAQVSPLGSGSNSGGELSSLSPPVFQPPSIPPGVVFIASFILVVMVGLVLWFINRWWQRSKLRVSTKIPLSELASIARLSLSEIENGTEWRQSILRCYARMNQVVAAKRSLERQPSMTPAEFAERLVKAGLPREPVHALTRLFEFERYGARTAGKAEINVAIASLRDILLACGESI